MIDDLKMIKKDYGEKMAHLCRELFPTILEKPGALYKVLSDTFAKYKYLYEDIIKEEKKFVFKEFIYRKFDSLSEGKEKGVKSVREILDEAGYILYECECFVEDNKDDKRVSVRGFVKYYAPNEELCSFKDPGRIENHYIFFIVKKNVDEIKRDNFKNPQREDEYSTSVLDLQFDKGDIQRVSIKSRYNHAVTNPDATYSNDLERIAPGLTEAFEREYGFNFGQNNSKGFELRDYVLASDGKYYKYNYEINNVYFCPNNIIINNGNVINKYHNDRSRYIVMDEFVLDRQEKVLFSLVSKTDSFVNIHRKIQLTKATKYDDITIVELFMEDGSKAEIKLSHDNRIISYSNKFVEEVKDGFLLHNKYLQELDMPNLRKCGNYFLELNRKLISLSLSNLVECGMDFVSHNTEISNLDLPKLEVCGDGFLRNNASLTRVYLPTLKKCGNEFLRSNDCICKLDLPNIETIGDMFLVCSGSFFTQINLPKVTSIGDKFLESNQEIKIVNMPCLRSCGHNFIRYNENARELNLPNLVECGTCFLQLNKTLLSLNLPKLVKCGDGFIDENVIISEVNLPELTECGDNFLTFNKCLTNLSLPKLKKCGCDFVSENSILKKVDLPSLVENGDHFIQTNHQFDEFNIPKLIIRSSDNFGEPVDSITANDGKSR